MKKLLLSLIASTSLFFGVNAQTILINPATDGGFESGSTFTANSWSVTNGTQVNQWIVSTNATAGFTGANCAYVSDSYSTTTTHSYVITTSSVVHFFRDVTVPAGETNIQLSFNWICQGEGTAFDRMRIWLVPTAFTPTAGTQVTATGTAPSGRIQAGLTNYNLQNTWTTANLVLPTAYAGTSFRIIFEWRNDASGGTMPPAGIDNISLTSSSCGAVPTALNTSTVLSSSANFTWTPGGSETVWDVYYGSQPLSVPNATTIPTATTTIPSYSATGLTQLTPYSVYVRANCGAGVYSTWTAVKNFTTTTTCPFPTNLSISAVGQTTASLNWNAGSSETTWLISYSAPTTTIITSTTPAYTLTGLNPGAAYSVKVQGICGAGDSSIFTGIKTFYTNCLPPSITSTTPGIRCGIGTSTLGATADPGAGINWYTSPSGGIPVATGSVFTTPSLSSTTDFYVSAVGAPAPGSGGRTAPTSTTSTTPATYGLVFNATKSFTLNTVDVYPTGASGSLLINLTDNTGAVLQSTTVALATGTVGVRQTINLNFSIPAGTGYRLLAISGPAMVRESALGGFPYALGSVGNITSGYIGGTSTTYYYFYNWVFSTSCESTLTAVTASVTLPDGVTAASSSTNLCTAGINTATLTAVQSGTTNAYSYTWTATPITGSGMPTSITGGTTSITPTIPGTYTYNLSASDGVCNTVSSITVMLNDIPDVYATISPTAVCSGAPVSLNAQSIIGSVTTSTLGSGATTSSTYPNPFYSLWSNTHNQYLITAAELSAANILAGNINSIAIDINSGTMTMQDFSIKIGHSTATNMSAFVNNAGFTTVFTAATLAPVVGLNTLNFSTPFNWDGVSNIVIEICHGNSGSSATMSSTAKVDNTSYISTIHTHKSAASAGAITCGDLTTNLTTYSIRPKFVFNATVGTNVTSSVDWQWNPGAINSNTAIINPINSGSVAITQVYTVTATNTAGACSNTATVSVLVNPIPSTPVATNSTQCGIGIPTASVSGGTNYNWYSTPTSTAVLQTGASTNYTTSISVTSTWYISAYDGTCESPRIALTQSVTIPDAITANSSANNLCFGGANTITLTATQTGTVGNPYVFTWTANPSSGSGIATPINGASVSVTPSLPNVYTYSVLASDGVCNTISSVTVALNNLPSINAMATPTTICSGENVNLLAESINAAIGTATVGNQTTTSSTGSPYRQGLSTDNKAQYLFTAAELNAAGIFQGNITELRFNATGAGSGQIDNFIIKLGSTTATSISTTYNTNATSLVYGPYSYSVTLGQNIHTFDTPFYWDGYSNLVIEICHDAPSPIGSSSTLSYQSAANRTIYSNVAGACAQVSGSNTTNRPVIGFGAQVGTNVTSSMDFVWNPGAINNNTAIVNPINTGSVASTQVYTATVTNTVTGCVNSTTVGVLVNPIPSTPVAFDNTQCGIGVPTASVSGNPNFLWYATPTSTSVLQAGTSPTYTSSISSTTTWYVSSFSGTCESPRVALTQTVTPPPALTIASPTNIICGNTIQTLSVSSTLADYDSYVWTPNTGLYTDASATIPYTSGNASTLYYMTNVAGSVNFSVNATSTVSGCATITNFAISTDNPAITASASPTVICSGSDVNLDAQSIIVANGTAAIGTGTTNSTTYPNPFYSLWSNTHNQYLIKASELTAANVYPGNINSLSIEINSGTMTMQDFSVKMGHSTATSMSAFVNNSGFTTVYTAASVSPVVGLNTLNFTTPFNWDGVSNIIIEICHGNSGSSATMSSSARVDNTPYVSTIHTHKSAASAGVITCGDLTTNLLTYSIRPKFTFNANVSTNVTSAHVWQWNPGAINSNTAIVNPVNTGSVGSTEIYTVTITNPSTSCSNSATVGVLVNPIPTVTAASSTASLCSGNSATLTANGATNYTWAPSGDMSSVSLVTPGSSTTYTVSGESLGCASSATVDLNVIQTPTVTASASPTVICLGNSATLTAVSSTADYAWAPAGGTADIAIVSPSSNTTYTVTSTNSGCVGTATVDLSVLTTPVLTVSPSSTLTCSGNSVTLTASGADTYTWSAGGGNAATAVFNPTTMTTYTVDGSNMCGDGTATVSINVDSPVTLSASTSATMICLSIESATLTTSGTATNFTWSPGGQTTANITVSPSVTTVYTVSTSNACGVVTSTVTQNVQDCTGIEELFAAGMNVYPNPTTDVVNFEIPAYLVGHVKLEIYDALGKVVALEELSKEVTSLKIAKFETGVYMFKMISNNGDVKIGRLIKQ